MVSPTAWRIFGNDVEIGPKKSMSGVQSFKVEWNGRFLHVVYKLQFIHGRLTRVEALEGFQVTPRSSGQMDQFTIQGEARLHADNRWGCFSIMQIAASYVSHSLLSSSIMRQIGAKIVDPTIALNEIPVDQAKIATCQARF